MKIIKMKKLTIFKLSAIIIFLIMIGTFTKAFAIQSFYNVDFITGLVTASTLNVRSGPGTNYRTVTTVNKNEYIRVFAGVGSWYIIQTENNYVGAVSQKYVKPIYPNTNNLNNQNQSKTNNITLSDSLSSDEKEVFDLINKQRTNNNLSALVIDKEVLNVARIKAKDMVDNNYFSHNSPTYGSPFDMLKSFKVSYNAAGENIAGNSNNSSAVNAWMNSAGHKANILSKSFNYTGIGVISSQKYGKIYVQMFIGK